jgi:hypothetical protein
LPEGGTDQDDGVEEVSEDEDDNDEDENEKSAAELAKEDK